MVRTKKNGKEKKPSEPWRELAQVVTWHLSWKKKNEKQIFKKPGDPCRGVARCDVRGSAFVPGVSRVRGSVSVVLVRGSVSVFVPGVSRVLGSVSVVLVRWSVSVPGVSQGAGDSFALLISPSRYTF
jgi:hypothetical protein